MRNIDQNNERVKIARSIHIQHYLTYENICVHSYTH